MLHSCLCLQCLCHHILMLLMHACIFALCVDSPCLTCSLARSTHVWNGKINHQKHRACRGTHPNLCLFERCRVLGALRYSAIVKASLMSELPVGRGKHDPSKTLCHMLMHHCPLAHSLVSISLNHCYAGLEGAAAELWRQRG